MAVLITNPTTVPFTSVQNVTLKASSQGNINSPLEQSCFSITRIQNNRNHGQPAESLTASQGEYSSNITIGNYQNYYSYLGYFFGLNARQDKDYLYIYKSDFEDLTLKFNNTGESILVALLLLLIKTISHLGDTRIAVNLWRIEFISNGNQSLKLSILLVEFYDLLIYLDGELVEAEQPLISE